MNKKHTPGPWTYTTNPLENIAPFNASIWKTIRFDNGEVGSELIAEVSYKKDANLIAAAPDLLEALEYLYNVVELTPEEKGKVGRVIAKAYGKEENND